MARFLVVMSLGFVEGDKPDEAIERVSAEREIPAADLAAFDPDALKSIADLPWCEFCAGDRSRFFDEEKREIVVGHKTITRTVTVTHHKAE